MREFFIKIFSCEEYAQRFLHKGEMRFSHIVSFQDICDCEVRGDKTEGITEETIQANIASNVKRIDLGNPMGGKQYVIDWEGVKKQFPEIANNQGTFQFKIEYQVDWLIYCLTYVNSSTNDIDRILNKCIEFGEYSVVICDCRDFLIKIGNLIPNCQKGLVKYSNDEKKDPFIKSLNYFWQQEYRIAIPANNNKEKFFNIGKLSGFVCKTRSLYTLKQML